MGMASTPAYWPNKKYRSSLQAVSQLSLPQAPRGFAARFSPLALLKPPSYAGYDLSDKQHENRHGEETGDHKSYSFSRIRGEREGQKVYPWN